MRHITCRTYDGKQNNLRQLHWGQANQPLLTLTDGHSDSIANPHNRPNPRQISNLVCREDIPQLNRRGLSDFVWVWGQFLAHELYLLPIDESQPLRIGIPADDAYLPGDTLIFYPFKKYSDPAQSESVTTLNRHSSYLDGTAVYGFNKTRADGLRSFDGSGTLRTSQGDLLPLLTVPGKTLLAGDKRANKHLVIAALHTLLVREHNRRCQVIINHCPQLKCDDEAIYQRARRYVGALLQVITYEEFLPALLGPDALGPYTGYNAEINTAISDIFATAALPLIHSMLPDRLRVENTKNNIGELLLVDAFARSELLIEHGIEPFLIGLTRQRARQVSVNITESVRSAVIADKRTQASRLKDLAVNNILRGRDLGLPDYNMCRELFYLAPHETIAEITTDETIRRKLGEAYANDLSQIDPWIGGLAETPIQDSLTGEFFQAVLRDQFERCRDGDRFWYENDPQLIQELAETRETLASFKRRRLSDVIRDNTQIKFLHGNVFYAGP